MRWPDRAGPEPASPPSAIDRGALASRTQGRRRLAAPKRLVLRCQDGTEWSLRAYSGSGDRDGQHAHGLHSVALLMEHEQLTGTVIGCAMQVHTILGPGYLESVYQNALAHELRKRGVLVE